MGKISDSIISAVLLISVTSHYASGYSGGASPAVCGSMIPGHGENPQPSDTNPYKIMVGQTSLQGFDTLDITLTSQNGNDIFKGFLIQVRKPGGDTAVGEFNGDGKDPDARTMSCFGTPNSAMTHTGSNEKKSVTVQWIAPNDSDGEYQV